MIKNFKLNVVENYQHDSRTYQASFVGEDTLTYGVTLAVANEFIYQTASKEVINRLILDFEKGFSKHPQAGEVMFMVKETLYNATKGPSGPLANVHLDVAGNVYINTPANNGWKEVGYTTEGFSVTHDNDQVVDIESLKSYGTKNYLFDIPSMDKKSIEALFNGETFNKGGPVNSVPNYIQGTYAHFEDNTLMQMAKRLPGIDQRVKYPCTCDNHDNPLVGTIYHIIMHLNDHCGWDREQVAQWLENIHDPTGETGPDLRFKTKETENED